MNIFELTGEIISKFVERSIEIMQFLRIKRKMNYEQSL